MALTDPNSTNGRKRDVKALDEQSGSISMTSDEASTAGRYHFLAFVDEAELDDQPSTQQAETTTVDRYQFLGLC